ncbi:MAG: hypothetical protein ABJA87_08280 [bacterium]
MSGLDFDRLGQLALRLEQDAGALRARAASLRDAAGAVVWRGRGADAFRACVGGQAGALRTTAGRLDDAADALRRHARAARRVEEVAEAAAALGRSVAHGVRAVAGAVADAL